MSADIWRGLWIQDKVRENRLRHLAAPQGLQLNRPRHRNAGGRGSGAYEPATVRHNASSREGDLLVGTTDGMSIDEVEKYLIDGATHAEIMEYLGDTYGPVFVKDLIKHLHNPRSVPRTHSEDDHNASSTAQVPTCEV